MDDMPDLEQMTNHELMTLRRNWESNQWITDPVKWNLLGDEFMRRGLTSNGARCRDLADHFSSPEVFPHAIQVNS